MKTKPPSHEQPLATADTANFAHLLTTVQNTECLNSFRFGLVIVWRIRIDEEGKVSPKLDLLTKVPQRGRPLGCECAF